MLSFLKQGLFTAESAEKAKFFSGIVLNSKNFLERRVVDKRLMPFGEEVQSIVEFGKWYEKDHQFD
ncbi:MAG: hypothetical protein M5U34_20395 [Chloroflexi bacterium]|nr:hypothetical protein [Chloroflexota bacterium]